jgi:hypothetical protein
VLRHYRNVFTELRPWRRGRDRRKLTSQVREAIRFWVPRLLVANATPQVDHNAGLRGPRSGRSRSAFSARSEERGNGQASQADRGPQNIASGILKIHHHPWSTILVYITYTSGLKIIDKRGFFKSKYTKRGPCVDFARFQRWNYAGEVAILAISPVLARIL